MDADRTIESQRAESTVARFRVDGDGIFHVDYKEVDTISLEDARDELDRAVSMNPRLPVMAVVDLSEVKSVAAEARDIYSGKKAGEIYSAVALVTRTPLSRVIGNLFLGINRPPMPVKLFHEKAKAIQWVSAQGRIDVK